MKQLFDLRPLTYINLPLAYLNLLKTSVTVKRRGRLSDKVKSAISLTGRYIASVLTAVVMLLLGSCSGSHDGQPKLADLYQQIDEEIDRSGEYMAIKEARIDSIRRLLAKAESLRERLDYSNRMTDEYESYKSDSALNYATESERIAEMLGDPREQARLQIKKADIASHAGLFSEAHEMLQEINRSVLDSVLLSKYYAAYCCLYQYETEYLPEGEYSTRTSNLRDAYTDSLIRVTTRDSFDYTINWVTYQINKGDKEAARKVLEANLKKYESGNRKYSILASIMAYLYKSRGETEKHHRYLAITVISDIKGAIKENMAIRELATEVFEEGDIDRANRYLKSSFDDANFFAARMRNAQSSRMLPVIDKAYDSRQHDLQRRLRVSIYAISCLFVLVVVAVIYIIRQMRRIKEANKAIGENNRELSAMSERLKEMNGKLEESNEALEESNAALERSNRELKDSKKIAEGYAGMFMESTSLNITELQKYHTALRKLAVQGNVKGILQKLDTTDIASESLKTFYSKFDEAILNIYPQFIDKVNNLLQEDSRITLRGGEKLNTELRVLALLRLGITDSEKIAEFLRCSLATIYTYRSKLKKKSLDPDNFENQIMTI